MELLAPADPRMAPHPLITAAANGRLPDWAVVRPARLAHIERVADLLGAWATKLGQGEEEQGRWRAAGYLHDALRDADADLLRPLVPEQLGELPDALLHGPAAAERLRADGVADAELLDAVAFHTLGDAGFGRLGRALYAADFLEPGRSFLPEWRADLRARAPDGLDEVVREVAGARIANLVDRKETLHVRTVDFWNALVAERHE
jgi:2-amino-4-hydroxy-6-hydroxymethyldihydropteridine diphosphokinase